MPTIGSDTKSDGTTQLADSIVQANNNLYRQFTDDPAVTSGAQEVCWRLQDWPSCPHRAIDLA